MGQTSDGGVVPALIARPDVPLPLRRPLATGELHALAAHRFGHAVAVRCPRRDGVKGTDLRRRHDRLAAHPDVTGRHYV